MIDCWCLTNDVQVLILCLSYFITTVQTKFQTISCLPGKQSMNPEYDARGAIQASCNYNNLPKLKVTGKNKWVVGLVHTD